MELFATVHVAFITSLLFSVFKVITCQDQVTTPGTLFVTEGENATIYCQFERSNLVALDWKKGEDVNSAVSLIRIFKGRTIRDDNHDPRFDMTSDSSLTINETTQADSGVYWCQVTLQGVFESSTNLTVLPVVTTTPAPTTAPTTTPSTEAATTKRKTTSGTTSSVVRTDIDIGQQVAESTSVTTTPGREPSINTVKPTKSDPKKQTSNNTTLYIIVGSCVGVVFLAIVVLVCYCCCCKSKSSNGYSKPNPNTPV